MADTPAPTIAFDDGDAYDRSMGDWSRVAGQVFLDWLAPAPGLHWVDVGCGSGAFTGLLMRECAPASIAAIDPSDGQLAFARRRLDGQPVSFQTSDAMALPFDDARFDAAVMALVLFFVPDPARGVAEMRRVVRPGGLVAAYVWDIPGGGLPVQPVRDELARLGIESARPPSADVSRIEALYAAWTDAGLQNVESRVIAIERTFDDFEAFWTTSLLVGALGATLAAMTPSDAQRVKDGVRARMPSDAAGRTVAQARAHAVRGHVPGGLAAPAQPR